MELAFRWADDIEPKVSRASRDSWRHGQAVGASVGRRDPDNRPDEAEAALRLARMAALGARRDFLLPYSPWHVFGPGPVAVTMAEHAAIEGRPEPVLEIGRRLEGTRVMRFAPSPGWTWRRHTPCSAMITRRSGCCRNCGPSAPVAGAPTTTRRTSCNDDPQAPVTNDEMRELADAVSLPLINILRAHVQPKEHDVR